MPKARTLSLSQANQKDFRYFSNQILKQKTTKLEGVQILGSGFPYGTFPYFTTSLEEKLEGCGSALQRLSSFQLASPTAYLHSSIHSFLDHVLVMQLQEQQAHGLTAHAHSRNVIAPRLLHLCS